MPAKRKKDTTRAQVLIIDDHPIVLEALAYTINDEIDMEVCGTAESADAALSLIDQMIPDVVIADLIIDDAHGFDLTQNILARIPDLPIIIFSMYDEHVYAPRALHLGAKGYLMKSEPTRRVIDAIRSVLRGDVYLSPRMTAQMLTNFARGTGMKLAHPIETLTDRELTVVQMLGNGFSIPHIMEALKLSRKTVETYRRRAREKLGFKTSSELLQFAIQWVTGQAGGAGEAKSDDDA